MSYQNAIERPLPLIIRDNFTLDICNYHSFTFFNKDSPNLGGCVLIKAEVKLTRLHREIRAGKWNCKEIKLQENLKKKKDRYTVSRVKGAKSVSERAY